jgi:hypothetical protein
MRRASLWSNRAQGEWIVRKILNIAADGLDTGRAVLYR